MLDGLVLQGGRKAGARRGRKLSGLQEPSGTGLTTLPGRFNTAGGAHPREVSNIWLVLSLTVVGGRNVD